MTLESHLSTSEKGQTEPLAALVAVATIAIAISLYASYVSMTVPAASDRSIEEPTLTQVWQEIETDGAYNEGRDLETAINTTQLPEGFTVYVVVSRLTDEKFVVVADRLFINGGIEQRDPPPSYRPPEDARSAGRSIPIRIEPGNITSGKLRVVVWQ